MRQLNTQFRFLEKTNIFCLFLTLCILQGCSGGGYNTAPWENNTTAQSTQNNTQQAITLDNTAQENINDNNIAQVKVAILLPLSGEHEKIGQSMLNAAHMALFDLGFDQYKLLPKDTAGTAEGAHKAAQEAVQDGATLVLGPLFSHSVNAARKVTQKANINMIAFSTDWRLANNNTYLIGFLPFDQVERAVNYSVSNGYKRIAVLSPSDSYGNGVVSAYQTIAQKAGAQTVRIQRIHPNGDNLNAIMRTFTDYDARQSAGSAATTPFDAILMPVGGPLARQVGSFLNHYDLPPQNIKRIGTGLLDDQSLASDRTLTGAWFAAPAPSTRRRFENSYNRAFYAKPPRIASLAYDATALSIILARMGIQNNGTPAFDKASITNPNGFAGVDGIFRFRRDGIVERGLAILEYRNGGIIVVDDAPTTFQSRGY